nr:MAG TPA: hypothetical protein [Caudoviricetes sp.]
MKEKTMIYYCTGIAQCYSRNSRIKLRDWRHAL